MGGWLVGSIILFVAITYGYRWHRVDLIRKWLRKYGISMPREIEKLKAGSDVEDVETAGNSDREIELE